MSKSELIGTIGILLVILAAYLFLSYYEVFQKIPELDSLLPSIILSNLPWSSFIIAIIGAEMYYGLEHIEYLLKS
jgi:hypothetical protein